MPETNRIEYANRGVQYAADEFTRNLQTHPIVKQTMSRKGNIEA